MNGLIADMAAGANYPNAAQADRAVTDMESLSGQLGALRRRLSIANDQAQNKLDHFSPTPVSLGAKGMAGSPVQEPEPVPGTMAALNYFASRTADEVARLEGLVGRLTQIL